MKHTLKEEKPPELRDHAEYAAAADRLVQLESALAEALRARDRSERKSCRTSSDSRRYLLRAGRLLPGIDESFLDEIVAEIVVTATFSPELISKVRSKALVNAFLDPSDIEIISEIEEARAIAELFERAVALERKECACQKKLAIAQICTRVRNERDNIARTVAGLFVQFSAALRQENDFVGRLAVQDAGLPALLVPPPFPIHGLVERPILQWAAVALGISVDDVEARLGKIADPAH